MTKVHVTISEPCRPNYFWASPKNTEFSGDYISFDNQYSTGELEHVYAPEMIDMLHSQIKDKAVHTWLQLLGVGGILDIGGTDPYILCRKIASRQMHHSVLSKISVKDFTPINEMKSFLIQNSFVINNIYLDQTTAKYVVTAQKSMDNNPMLQR